VIDDRTMGDLRMAATLVHALPGIVLRVDGSRASHRVGHVLLGPGDEPEDQVPLALHRDAATEVTLVHTGSDDDHLDLAVNAMEAALARCATAELVRDLYAGIGSAQPP
jgi:hypothetical protein